MLGRLKFLILYLCSWLVFFAGARLLFLMYHLAQTKSLSFTTVLQTFFYGLRMDLSMAAYILLPVCFFVLTGVFIPFFRQTLVYKVYTAIVLFFLLLIIAADLELYKQWGFRIDATPLKYLSSPKEAWASVSHLPVFWIILFFAVVYFLLVRLFHSIVERINKFQQYEYHKILSALLVLVFTGLLIIPLRGGLQLSPINQSSVYFSNSNFANHAALNASWNFLQALLSVSSTTYNPYNYLPPPTAKDIVDSLYATSGKTVAVINTTKPNVLLIIWESFTDKATHLSFNGKEVTPNFNALKKEGIYFSQVYASGDRTDKGLAAILSGYPALPSSSIVRNVNKSAKLAVLSKLFQSKGYHTPFYYGGEPEFANIKSYLLRGGFDPIIEKSDFASKDQNSKWGAHDGVVAERIVNDLKTINQPFFVTWLTLSSHEPFEIPVATMFQGDDRTTKFLNSLHYTDEVIADFIAHCKQKSWWNNTLLIIIADHGHPLPESGNKVNNFTIPMLWIGGALAKKGDVVDKISSQLDLAGTLAAQIGFAGNHFPFSKNIFDSTTKQWAFFSFNNGFGLIQPQKQFIFDNVGRQVILQKGLLSKKDIIAGQALQQQSFQDYLDK